ncbi:beta strand repeat-containing protein [Candidatus Magnetaquiglobus chichijimensis]
MQEGRIRHGLIAVFRAFIVAVLMLFSGQVWAATGGQLLVTSSTDTAAPGSFVDVTVAVSANADGTTKINTAGVIVQWDHRIFALDAGSVGTSGDNDPHKTKYLEAYTDNEGVDRTRLINNENSRITMIANTGGTDSMVSGISEQSVSGETLFGVSNQAFINYTRLTSMYQANAVINNYKIMTLRLVVKSGATAGSSSIKAWFKAVSDNKSSTVSSYTEGTAPVTVVLPTMDADTNGTTRTGTVNTAVSPVLGVYLHTIDTPNANVDVTFTADAGGNFAGGTAVGGKSTITVKSGSNGIATAPAFTLPQTAGVYTVTASATGYTSKTFTLTATAGAAASLAADSGTGQSGTVDTNLANPFGVIAKDAYNNVVSGATVTFAVAGGGGSLSSTTANTNSSGIATSTLKLGQTAGVNSVTASVAGVANPVTFTATGNAGAATQVVLGASSSTVSATSANQVTLTGTLKDSFGNTVTSDNTTVVTFVLDSTSYGTLTSATATAGSGVATTTLNTVAQPQGTTSLVISVDASTPTILASSVTNLPITLAYNVMTKNAAGDTQTGTVNTALTNAMSVTLTTGGAAITTQQEVTFTASAGKFANGTDTTKVTTVNGVATATTFTLGTTAGTQTITVSASGFPSVTFTQTANAGAAASLAADSGTGQSGTVDTNLANPFGVIAKDAYNNVVSGATVTFAVAGGGGSLSSTTANTNSSGIATSTLKLGQTAGVNSVTASVAGVANPVTFTATGNAGAATQVVLGASSSTVSATSANQVTLTGTLKDSFGNTVTSDNTTVVTFVLDSTSYGTLTSATATAGSGVATTTLNTVAQPQGTTSLVISVDASTPTILASSVTNLPITLAYNVMTKNAAGDTQTGTVNTALTNAMSVTLTTGGAAITTQQEVTFTASAGKFANGTDTTKVTTVNGVATATTFTLGTTAGTQTITVSASGFPSVTFTQTANAGAAASLAADSGTGQSGTVDTNLANPFGVIAKDAYNNVVSGATVTFAVAGGGGSLSSTTANTNSSGIATSTLKLGRTAGVNSVTASVAGVANPVTFTATGTHATPTKLIIGLSSTQSGAGSAALTMSAVNQNTVHVSGTLKDQFDNVATSATNAVTFSLDATTYGTLTTTTAVTPTNGVAMTTLTTVAQDVSSTATRTIDVNGAATGLAVTKATLTLAPFSVNPNSATLVIGDTRLFEVVGTSSTTPSWANSNTTAGSLSAASGNSSTYTALAATGATPATLTVTGNVGGTQVAPTASVTIYAPVATSKSTASALLVSKTDNSLIITGGNGSYTCTSSDTAVATVAAQATNSICAITTLKTGTFTVTVKDTATYNGKTGAGADRTENAVTTATIEVVDPITVTGLPGKILYLDTVTTTGGRNTAKLVPVGGGSGATYSFTSADAAKVSVDSAGNVTGLGVTDGVKVTIKSNKYTEIATDVTVIVKSALSFKDTAATEIDVTKAQTTTSGGAALRFAVSGGAGNLSVTVKGPWYGTSSETLTATNGVYTFNAPTTGAFAGVYTVTVTDPDSGWIKEMTVNVPYKVAISARAMLSSDLNQSVSVTGGKLGDQFKLTVVDGAGVADTTVKIAGLLATKGQGTATNSLTATAVAGTGTEPASAAIVPASGLTKVTSFKVKAVALVENVESTVAWATATSESAAIVPVSSYTLTVTDGSNVALNGATIALRDKTTLKTEFNMDWVNQTTGTDGKATFSLPVGGKYAFDVTPANATTHLTNSITLESTQTTGTVVLRAIGKPIKFRGALSGETAATLTDISVSVLDSTGKRVFGTAAVAAGVANTTYSYVVSVDSATLTPDRLVIAAKDMVSDVRSVKTVDLTSANGFTVTCVDGLGATQTLETMSACLAVSGNTWQVNVAAIQLKSPPTVGVVTGDTSKLVVGSTTFALPTTGGVQETLDSTLSGTGVQTASLVTAVPTFIAISDKTDTPEFKDIALTTSESAVIKEVGIAIPANAFKSADVANVVTKVNAVKLDNAATDALTGGEVLEIKMFASDKSGNVLSTASGNTIIDSSVGIPIEVPVSKKVVEQKMVAGESICDAAVKARMESGYVFKIANTLADLNAGTKVESLPFTFNCNNGGTPSITVKMPHFSVGAPATVSTSGGGGGGGGGCFIATAAYGSYEEPHVQLLREFRDRYLLTNALGGWFVEQYYNHSPVAADWLREHDAVKPVVRVLLLPLIGMSWLLLTGSMPAALGLMLLIAVPVALVGWRRRSLVKVSGGLV